MVAAAVRRSGRASALVALGIFVLGPSYVAADCSGASAGDYACYQQRYQNLVRDSGVETAFDELKDEYGKNGFVRSNCHQLSHVIGRAAAGRPKNTTKISLSISVQKNIVTATPVSLIFSCSQRTGRRVPSTAGLCGLAEVMGEDMSHGRNELRLLQKLAFLGSGRQTFDKQTRDAALHEEF